MSVTSDLSDEFEPGEDRAILFVTAGTALGFPTDFDITVNVSYLRVPNPQGGELVLGIDDELNVENFFECVVYGVATEEQIEHGGASFCGATVDPVGYLSDIVRTVDPAAALQGWLSELAEHGYEPMG